MPIGQRHGAFIYPRGGLPFSLSQLLLEVMAPNRAGHHTALKPNLWQKVSFKTREPGRPAYI